MISQILGTTSRSTSQLNTIRLTSNNPNIITMQILTVSELGGDRKGRIISRHSWGVTFTYMTKIRKLEI